MAGNNWGQETTRNKNGHQQIDSIPGQHPPALRPARRLPHKAKRYLLRSDSIRDTRAGRRPPVMLLAELIGLHIHYPDQDSNHP